jgi:uncharacterized repeat protein (TIGR04076 family)
VLSICPSFCYELSGIGDKLKYCIQVFQLASLNHIGGHKMSSETTGCFEDGAYRVEVKVLSQKGTCHFGHQMDDVIVFDGETVQGRICISALYSLMPKVFAMRYGAEFPWLKDDKDVSTHACPDAFNPVVFEIRRIRD